jgi:hypothetical protein
MKSYLQIFLEATLDETQQSSTQEFLDAVDDYYGDDEVSSMIRSSEQMLGRHIDTSQIQTEKTDNENLIIRFYEDPRQIFILGMISKSGKINRNDLNELKEWMSTLKQKMKRGKVVMSSLNKFSFPIMSRVVKELEADGFSVNKSKMNTTKIKGVQWDTYQFITSKRRN